jgi:hypothetical protein
MIVLRHFLSVFTFFLVVSISPFCQGVIINEIDALTSEGPQFVEFYGSPNTGLEGHSLALIRSVFLGGGAYGVEVYDAISLEGQSLDSEGFLSIELELNTTIAAVAIYELDISMLTVGATPPTDEIVDALVYGNTSPTHPQAAILIQAIMPSGSGLLNEGTEENPTGHSLSRLPNGGDPFDLTSYALQAPSMGVTNVLSCDGGMLELTNLANDTLCTDQGPAIATFTHDTDALSALLTLFVINPADGIILGSASGSAINFQDLGDGAFDVIAVSHDTPIDAASLEVGMPISGLTGPDCLSQSLVPYSIFCITCESPACDGGTMLDASGSEEVLACLTPDGALVPFGYFSEAVEDDFLFAISTLAPSRVPTVKAPFNCKRQ